MESLKKVSISKLKENDQFKLFETRIKFHVFEKIIHLGENVPPIYKGKSLIIRKNGRRLLVNANNSCYVKTTS
jgi:hypothetical protein